DRQRPLAHTIAAFIRGEVDASHDSVRLDHQIVLRIRRQESVVALEIARAGKIPRQRCEVFGDQLELADAPPCHGDYRASSAARSWRATRSSTELTKVGSLWP